MKVKVLIGKKPHDGETEEVKPMSIPKTKSDDTEFTYQDAILSQQRLFQIDFAHKDFNKITDKKEISIYYLDGSSTTFLYQKNLWDKIKELNP